MVLREMADTLAVDSRKLVDYALNPESPSGRHKAVVFAQALGFTRENYRDLLVQIEEQALDGEAVFHSEDRFGSRYTVDMTIWSIDRRSAVVRTGWLVNRETKEARLLTLYVRK